MTSLSNRTAVPGTVMLIQQTSTDFSKSDADMSRTERDGIGAGYYVIVVILVYGMSIVALIASHIKRKHAKLLEDRQIHNYLKEFQVVRETSARDSYRSLKRSIVDKLSRGTTGYVADSAASHGRRRSSSGCSSHSGGSVSRCLGRAVLPLTAPLGLPANVCSVSVVDEPDGSKQRRLPSSSEPADKFDNDCLSAATTSRRRLERRRHALRVVSPVAPPTTANPKLFPLWRPLPSADEQHPPCCFLPEVADYDTPVEWYRDIGALVTSTDMRPVPSVVVHLVCPRCRLQQDPDTGVASRNDSNNRGNVGKSSSTSTDVQNHLYLSRLAGHPDDAIRTPFRSDEPLESSRRCVEPRLPTSSQPVSNFLSVQEADAILATSSRSTLSGSPRQSLEWSSPSPTRACRERVERKLASTSETQLTSSVLALSGVTRQSSPSSGRNCNGELRAAPTYTTTVTSSPRDSRGANFRPSAAIHVTSL